MARRLEAQPIIFIMDLVVRNCFLSLYWFAVCFSVAIVFALGFVGNMVQANSISIALNNAFHIPSYIIGVVLAAVVGVVIIGGQRRITAIAAF